jgi:hypothetical protein
MKKEETMLQRRSIDMPVQETIQKIALAPEERKRFRAISLACRECLFPTFISFTYRSETTGEVSKRVVLMNFKYNNIIRKDLDSIRGIKDAVEYIAPKIGDHPFDEADFDSARLELMESMLSGKFPSKKTRKKLTESGSLMYCEEKLQLYIVGLSISKKVIKKAEEKVGRTNKRNPVKTAKKAVTKQLRCRRIRNFLVSNIIGEIKMNKQKI